MNFKKINNIAGWVVFAIAMLTYALTMEKTASFWDCGEFIAAADKLQVVHAPGAPLYLMLGRFFSMFVPAQHVALAVNLLSALSTALAAMFVYWSIAILAKRLLRNKEGELEGKKIWAVIASGIIGALAFVYQDSQWFNAVEAEVYAVSTLLTSAVVWMALKWSEHANEKWSDRLLLGIAYIIGLSLGVHLLNLLALPAIALLFYFYRTEKVNVKGIVLAFLAGCGLLLLVQYGIILELPKLASAFELSFVNGMGLPFGSGLLFLVILIVTALITLIHYANSQKKLFLYIALGALGIVALSLLLRAGSASGILKFLIAAALVVALYVLRDKRELILKGTLGLSFILIGYLSYIMVPIRSNANPPIDINNPENVFNLLSYLNREQYGDRPLLYGNIYTAKPIDYERTDDVYIQKEGKYVDIDDKIKYVFKDEDNMLFPRVWNIHEEHKKQFYADWLGIGKSRPSMFDNLNFLYTYQLDFMYWRYFLWNFGGRQNDIQGHGGPSDGNWESGIEFIDSGRTVKADAYPDSLALNKAKNHFYLIPFILGLIGVLFHFKYNYKDAGVLTALFLLTGIAIVFYLNQEPMQPRERDYAYVGSFMAFAMWIGLAVAGLVKAAESERWKNFGSLCVGLMGVMLALLVLGFNAMNPITAFLILVIALAGLAVLFGIAMLLKDKSTTLKTGVFAAITAIAPILMVSQGWDDHNRNKTHLAQATGKNYLNSTLPNSIIFTEGDNDTYTLWYAQGVEGVREDVRIVNNSLLKGDWYIDQVKQHNGLQPGLDITFDKDDYEGSKLEVTNVLEMIPAADLSEVIKFVKDDSQETKRQLTDGEWVNFIPTNTLVLPVDLDAQVKNGVLTPEDAEMAQDTMIFRLPKERVIRDELMILDLIARYINERPIFFTGESLPNNLGLSPYIRQEGTAFRLTSILDPQVLSEDYSPFDPHVNAMRSYDLIMNTLDDGNVAGGAFLNDNARRQGSRLLETYVKTFAGLARIDEKEKAIEIYDLMMERFFTGALPMDDLFIMVKLPEVAEGLYAIGENEKASELSSKLVNNAAKMVTFVATAPRNIEFREEKNQNARATIYNMTNLAKENGNESDAQKFEEIEAGLIAKYGE